MATAYLLPGPCAPGPPPAAGLLRARLVRHASLAADPRRPIALQELGVIFGQESGSLRALCCLRRSNECDPHDPQTAYRLAFAA